MLKLESIRERNASNPSNATWLAATIRRYAFRNWHRVVAAVMVVRSPEVTKGCFDMPSDDGALNVDRRCPVCHELMRVVRLESGVPGLPPAMRRQIIKCPACELVTFRTFALEPE